MKKQKKYIQRRDYPFTLRMEGWSAAVAFISASAAVVGVACFQFLTARCKK